MWKNFCIGLMAAMFSVAEAAPASGITDIEAVTEVFGDGENLSAVILTYEKPILDKSVSVYDFKIPERTISRAYVSNKKQAGDSALQGNYIILELESLPMVEQEMPTHPKADRELRESQGKRGPTLGSHGNAKPLQTFTAEINQIGTVRAADGTIYRATNTLKSSHTRQLVIEDFVQDIYTDPAQDNATLPYNLYIPKNYDPSKVYPLVLFMHDAGAVSPEVKTALCQGRGAVAWATTEWQTENPCFVLAPQFDTVIVDDNSNYGLELDRTIHLLEYLSEKYPIDRNRIYNTGQSMGGMTSIAMDIKYPNFFAASYLVACQWNADLTMPLGNQNIWAVVSENDPGAGPGMEKIFNNLESNGATVIRQTVDATDPSDIVNAQVSSIIQTDCHLYCTTYKGGSHRYTWQHAYDMLPAMRWIFAQSK